MISSSSFLISFLFSVSLFLYFFPSFHSADANRDCQFTQNAASYPTPSCDFGLTFNITSPVDFIGSIGYLPNSFSPPILTGGVTNWGNLRVMIPNPAEDIVARTYGCIPPGKTKVYTQTADRDGNWYDYQALLVQSGRCSLAEKLRGAKELNVSMLIIVEQTSLDYTDPVIYTADPAVANSIVTITIARGDGNSLLTLLQDVNLVVDVRMAIQPAGVANANTKTNVYNIVSNLHLNPLLEATVANTKLKTFSQLTSAAMDPCSSGLIFIWCEGGEVVFFGIAWSGTTGTLHDVGFSSLDSLIFVQFASGTTNSITGSFPTAWCGAGYRNRWWRNLLIDHNQFSDIGNCWLKAPQLLKLSATFNLLKTFPDSLIGSNIVEVFLANNKINQSLPELTTWTALQRISLSNNLLSGAIPSFQGMSQLRLLELDHNTFTSLSSVDCFNGLTYIRILAMEYNQISGSLPTLSAVSDAFDSLGLTLSFHHNQFSGLLPWDFFFFQSALSLQSKMDFSYNKFSDVDSFIGLKDSVFTTIDLSHNLFTFPAPDSNNPSLVTILDFVATLMQVNGQLVDLNVGYNNIAGPLKASVITTIASGGGLKRLSLAGCQITALPADLFARQWESLDFSNNALNGTFDDFGTPWSGIAYFNLQSNPTLLANTLTVPSWLGVNRGELRQTSGSNFTCFPWTTPNHPILTFIFDALATSCQCNSGFYGFPSTGCMPIPSAPVRLDPAAPLPSLVTNGIVPDNSFTDTWYGDRRQISGMDVEWRLDASQISIVKFPSSAIGYYPRSLTDSAPTINSVPKANLKISPARLINVFVHLDLSLFNSPNDILTIYSFVGIRRTLEAEIRGSVGAQIGNIPPTPFITNSALWPADVFTSSYRTKYESNYINFTMPAVVSVPIFTSNVVLFNFQSRKETGRHFFANYILDSTAPSGYTINAATGLYEKDIPIYKVNSGLLYAMYALAGVVSSIVAVTTVYLYTKRANAVVRAASKPFVFFVLFMLFSMSCTSVLFAIVPEDSSNYLCDARIWCSCLILMSILGVLFAKSFRIALIFDQKSMRVKSVSDLKVAGIAGILVAIQILMCAVLSGMNMTWPAYISNGSNEVVRGCNTGNGFGIWIGVNIAIFAVTMVAGAYIAFKTRNVPSAFNESHHILYSLVLLLFFLLMLVPLDLLLVGNSPEASVLIQSAGQILLTFFLLVFNFAPKVYYLYTGLGSDKSLTNTMPSAGSALRSTTGRSNQVQPTSSMGGGSAPASRASASPAVDNRKLEMQVLKTSPAASPASPQARSIPQFKSPAAIVENEELISPKNNAGTSSPPPETS